MILINPYREHPGIILDNRVTAEAAAELTGYNIQHIRRLAYAGKLDAIHVGRSWLIKIESVEVYLSDALAEDDARFGPRSPARSQTDDDANDTGGTVTGTTHLQKGGEPFHTSERNE